MTFFTQMFMHACHLAFDGVVRFYWVEEKYTNCVVFFSSTPFMWFSLKFLSCTEFLAAMETLRADAVVTSADSCRLWRRRSDVERTSGVVCLIIIATLSCKSKILRSFCRRTFSKFSIWNECFRDVTKQHHVFCWRYLLSSEPSRFSR